MLKKSKWNYDVIKNFINEWSLKENKECSLYSSSMYLKSIADNISEKFEITFTPEAFLVQIQKSKKFEFLNFTYPLGYKNFFKDPRKYMSYKYQYLQEGLVNALIKFQEDYNVVIPKIEYEPLWTLNRNIEHNLKLGLNEIEVLTELYKKKHIEFVKGTPVMNSENIKIENEVDLTLSILRLEIAKAFNHETDSYNVFLFNDGTGSGKTFNVLINYIKSFTNIKECLLTQVKRQNLIFTAPQKNQLFVSLDVFDLAKEKNLPLLFNRSEEDLVNLESSIYFKTEKNNFYKVGDFFNSFFKEFKAKDKEEIEKDLVKIYKNELIQKNIYEEEDDLIEKVTFEGLIYSFNSYYNFEAENNDLKKYASEQFKEKQDTVKKSFQNKLKALANNLVKGIPDIELNRIYNDITVYNDFELLKEKFGYKAPLYKLAYILIAYVMPFEVTKYINAIVYMTGDKAKYTIQISRQSLKNPKVKMIARYSLEDLISGFSIDKKANIIPYVKNNVNFGQYLNNEMFIKDENSYFLNNKIGFSVVQDEEHVLYNNYIKKYSYVNVTEPENFTKRVNTLHAMAAMYRWFNNVSSNSYGVVSSDGFEDEKTKIVNRLFSNLKDKTILKTDEDIKEFFHCLHSNEKGMVVKMSDYEFISSVCNNIISYNPKLIMLQEYLKSIKIVLNAGSDKLVILKDTTGYEDANLKYSVYDYFQVVLTMLFVCKDISGKFTSVLFNKERYNNQNQNSPLYYFINIAKFHKEFLENLFNSSVELEPTDELNIQFTYFMKKIGFNFKFMTDIDSHEYYQNGKFLPVEPHIFIMKELPEVSVLHLLKNPLNKVFIMSATRGFRNVYCGNYSEDFFNQINEYVPGLIKVYKRELEDENIMPFFIEKRFENRKEIQVNKIVSENNIEDSSKDIVKECGFKVNDVSLKNLTLSDLYPSENISSLIKNTSVNYISSLVKRLVSLDEFKRIAIPYNKAEILNVCNSIVHSYENNLNSLVMTLSNRFYTEFMSKDEIVNKLFPGSTTLIKKEDDHNNHYKIREFKPEGENGKKIRLICYNSTLGRKNGLEDFFKLDTDTIVIVITAYKSAGTGLNLTLLNSQTNSEQDFEALYFTNTPYFTDVKGDNGYSGLNNQILIHKAFANMGGKTLGDLGEGLASNEIKGFLRKEHIMEKVKTIMQSVGRIERRDSQIFSKIYFIENGIESFFDEVMSDFYQMFRLHENSYEKSIVANFSMMNKCLLKSSINHVKELSLSDKDRNILETESLNSYKVYYEFFTSNKIDGFRNMMMEYRKGNKDFSWFEEMNYIFRQYVTPEYDLKIELKKFIKSNNESLKKVNCYQSVINLMKHAYFDFEQFNISDKVLEKITVDYKNFCYTDYTKSSILVNDKMFFDYGDGIKVNEIGIGESFLKDVLKKYSFTNKLTKLPNLYLYHLIRGNIGEHVLSEYLKSKNIKFNNLDTFFDSSVSEQLYELFDFYVVKNKKIYCIDTKNWSCYNDNGAKKTLEKFPEKVSLINKNPLLKDYEIEFVYLNMFPTLNNAFSKGLSNYLGDYEQVKYVSFIRLEREHKKIDVRSENNRLIKTYYKEVNPNYKISKEWRNIL